MGRDFPAWLTMLRGQQMGWWWKLKQPFLHGKLGHGALSIETVKEHRKDPY